MALGKSLPFAEPLFARLPNGTMGGGGEASSGRAVTLEWVLLVLLPSSDIWAKSVRGVQWLPAWGGLVLGEASARREGCAGACWPSLHIHGGSEAPYIAFFFFLGGTM